MENEEDRKPREHEISVQDGDDFDKYGLRKPEGEGWELKGSIRTSDTNQVCSIWQREMVLN